MIIRPPFSILCVEDNPQDREVLKRALEDQSVSLHLAANEEEARAALQDLTLSAHPPDLILLDHHLSHSDGLELVAHIRATKATRHTPVVVYSGQISPEVVERGKRVGVQAFVQKPHDLDTTRDVLGSMISFWRSARRQMLPLRTSPVPVHSTLRRVVHLEDDPSIRALVQLALTMRDKSIEVHTRPRTDGWQSYLTSVQPDVVLLDVKVGGTCGMQLCRDIRAFAPSLPVVFLTGMTGFDREQRLLALGAAGVIPKPFNVRLLTPTLTDIVNQWHQYPRAA